MSEAAATAVPLAQFVARLAADGLHADRARLKRVMASQFSDPWCALREYVANSVDAASNHVAIDLAERTWGDKPAVTLTIRDNGRGMGRPEVQDYMWLFRSASAASCEARIGRFGIGRLSLFALPVVSFRLETSTGEETWVLETASVLDDGPVCARRTLETSPPGTAIEVTLVGAGSVDGMFANAKRVLQRYCAYMPAAIVLRSLREGETITEFRTGNAPWREGAGRWAREFDFEVQGKRCQAVLAIGPAAHEIYVKRVFITDRHDLVSESPERRVPLPHLLIRVDTPFELALGRHAVDDSVLGPLAEQIRERCLPEFLRPLDPDHGSEAGLPLDWPLAELDALACGVLSAALANCTFLERHGMFLDVAGRRHSLADLKRIFAEKGRLYVEGPDMEGVDFGAFDAPVLSCRRQPEGALSLLANRLPGITALGAADTVIEAPAGQSPPLGDAEKRFERHLGFNGRTPRGEDAGEPGSIRIVDFAFSDPLPDTQADLEDLVWRVAYLVQRDGRTPCMTRTHIHNGGAVILNVYHGDVQGLVRLARRAPELASHWALQMVLSDTAVQPLSHLSPPMREEIVRMDAVIKAGGSRRQEADLDARFWDGFQDFRRNVGTEQ